jgi:hypothetical protein
MLLMIAVKDMGIASTFDKENMWERRIVDKG